VLLSRNAGAYTRLGRHVIGVNPFDLAETAEALNEALTLAPEERARRARGLARTVQAHTPASWLASQLEAAENKQSFVRSFAYASGPAYGFLLDRSKSGWRKGLKPSDDLGVLAQHHHAVKLPTNLKAEAEKRSAKYGGDSLSASENERESRRQKRVEEHRARLVNGPILVLPLTDKVSYGFDPNNVESLDSLGTVYPTLRMSDAWGILEVTRGALMILEGPRVSRIQVPAPADPSKRRVEGDGWTLELSEGWTLVPGSRNGDYSIKKNE